MAFNIPNCFTNDCDCQGTPPSSDYCPNGECFSCIPSECEGEKCCCCSTIDIVLGIRAQCYNRALFSCNRDGDGFGGCSTCSPPEGDTPFPPECTSCFEACDRAMGGDAACASIYSYVPGFDPSPLLWWTFPPAVGPCTCDCIDYVDPQNPSAGCNLTCVTCQGMECNANVDVTSSSCSYQFALTPGSGCCGVPAFVDAVFCIDYSGSMNDKINDVITNVSSFAEQLEVTGGLARFGLIVYGKAENDVTPIMFGGDLLTTDVNEFIAAMQAALPTSGGDEPDFDAAEYALFNYPWSGAENLLWIISDELVDEGGTFPIQGDFGNPTGQPSAQMLGDLANNYGVTVIIVQPQPGSSGGQYDSRKTDLAMLTNGFDLDLLESFDTLLDEMNLTVFGSSCDCLDQTPIPVELCPSGVIDDDCDPNIPIRICVEDDNSDCLCNEPQHFNVCGEIVTITPDEDTINLVCCGEIPGGGCQCPTTDQCVEGCCGVCGADICTEYATKEAAIEGIWCECWNKAIAGEFVLETSGCSDCVVPSPGHPDYEDILNCVIKVCNAAGQWIPITRSQIVAEVEVAWVDCIGGTEPPEPEIDESDCRSVCNRADECLVGDLVVGDSDDIRQLRKCSAMEEHAGCASTRNPSTTVLNNGIGLVAYESLENNSVIQIDQFNTSVPAKILPNRTTNYGRLQHELNWTTDGAASGTKLPKFYYYESIPEHFMNGVIGIPPAGTLMDMIMFKSGPLMNQCFSLHAEPVGSDDVGSYIQFTVPVDYTLSHPFDSSDDVYNIEWILIDGDDTGLTGSATDTGDTPGSDFLLGTNEVNAVLKLSPHVHNGVPVPVAHPSIASAHNYMNELENSHYVYLTYQALEDTKWNVYLRQIRLSEYSRQEQLDDSANFETLNALGIGELIYRAVCVNDNCTVFGDDFLVTRTITMEVALQDGREVFNSSLMDVSESWPICPGVPAGDTPKRKTFVEFTHSVTSNRCPDQFEFNDIFYNWDVGDEFDVPFSDLTAELLFQLLAVQNDSVVGLGDSTVEVSGITITSSQAGVVWYEDPSISAWSTVDPTTFNELLRYKGLDVSEPIPITEFENGHCTHPIVRVNSNNDVYVAYECTDPMAHQIHVVGTAVPSSSLPLGVLHPKNLDANLDYFLSPNDFIYHYQVTGVGDEINQLPDLFIDENDVLHLAWQSNRDRYWEIYYANSTTGFEIKRITEFKSRSFRPSIAGDDGNIHIVWHDDRFGNWEILMAYQDGTRVPTLAGQDPYLATVRNDGYSHYLDIAPLTFTNSSASEPVCVYDVVARFYKDRFLRQSAFIVEQRKFPEAFQIPGIVSDQSSLTISDFSDWTKTIVETYPNFASPVLDVGIAGAILESVSLTYYGGLTPRQVMFTYGDLEDFSNTLSAAWLDISAIQSGEVYQYADLDPIPADQGSEAADRIPTGRYMKIDLQGTDSGTEVTELAELVLTFTRPGRLCISPGETITGYFDMTPVIRLDPQGIEVVESPLPVEAEKNVAYFMIVTATSDTGVRVFPDPKVSVSCETCAGDSSPWDAASCSVHVSLVNSWTSTRYFNARVRFYADQDKLDLIAQFDAFKDQDGNLENFSLEDNKPAESYWGDDGLELLAGRNTTIALWPMLSNTTGLFCGIVYWVEISVCSSIEGAPCERGVLEQQSLEKWVCDCGSTRLDEGAPTNIRDLDRWVSSGDGFADTRLTETGINNLNPMIQFRSDRTGLVLYETNRDDPDRSISENDVHSIYATAFSVFPASNMYASGAEAITSPFDDVATVHVIKSDIPITGCGGTDCDDDGVAILGRNPSFALDQYDNIFMAAEQQNDQSVCEELETDKQQSIIVHRCGAQPRNLVFDTKEGEVLGTCECENILGKTSPLIEDRTWQKIIRMARVKNNYVQYHIVRQQKPAAVVDQCNVAIEVISEPETIAIRLRNEGNDWSTWFPFDPDIGENTMSIPWELSLMSGVKGVTVQAATYQGLAASFSMTIIADYRGVDHTVKFYKSSDVDSPQPGETSSSDLLAVLAANPTVFDEDNLLPSLESIPVAGIRQPVLEGSDVVQDMSEFIFVEIKPSQAYIDALGITSQTLDLIPTFDVLQQGRDDLFFLPMEFADGTFRGVFPIWKEDKIRYQDGLSFVIPHFKADCADSASVSQGTEEYVRDRYNLPTSGNVDIFGTSSATDAWSGERDEVGRVQYKMDIRGTEDPYFAFGDPNYRLKKETE